MIRDVSSDAALTEALAYAALGWHVVPLHSAVHGACSCRRPDCRAPGKHPRIITGALHSAATVDPTVIRQHWSRWPGTNVGIVTGAVSGLVVVDIDPRNGGERPEGLPETAEVLTGGGGWHLYYRLPPGRRQAPSPWPGVDLKGEGGYVVAPPSVHATGRAYAWEASSHPDDVTIADAPEAILQPTSGEATRTGPAVLGDEISDGRRNSTLMSLAGTMRRVGMSREAILAALERTNSERCRPPLTSDEVESIARSVARYSPEAALRASVMAPGVHLLTRGTTIYQYEVSESAFATGALDMLPGGTIYRRGQIVGELYGATGDMVFRGLTPHRLILHVGEHVRIIQRGAQEKDDRIRRTEKVITQTVHHAQCVLARADTHHGTRHLARLSSWQVYVDGWRLTQPGWDEESSTYTDDVETITPIPWDTESERSIDDMLVDFPWASEADRQNFVGLLITLMVRPMIRGNVPITMCEAALPRTGKSKLMVDLLGTLFQRRPFGTMMIGADDAELEKRITSVMLAGRPVICLDNLSGEVDYPSLAALVTSSRWSGRMLGSSTHVDLPNESIVIATANSVRASAELLRRIVPIVLQPRDDRPESRTEFRHGDLEGMVSSSRVRVLGTLAGLVERWVAAGRPAPEGTLGGFEAWYRIVGGIMRHAGYSEWMRSRETWAQAIDSDQAALEILVAEWYRRYQSTPVSIATLTEIAIETGEFAWVEGRKSPATSFGRYIGSMRNRPVCGYTVRAYRSGRTRGYMLEIDR